jgi:DNA/RNA-binding domain of Phe-tRNA-synthetase-like protein
VSEDGILSVSPAWRTAYPGAHAGLLELHDVDNPASHPELERMKLDLESRLRAQFAGQDRHSLDVFGPIPAYAAYYRQFKKTYPVGAQLESIVFKDRSIPSVAALVEAMFMAEVKNLLLTAGHDLDSLQLPLTLDVATGLESYTLLRGQEQALKAGDMFMTDGAGVISSVVYGPDQRTAIEPHTRRVLFVVYAPGGILAPAVEAHLEDIREYVRVVSPQATVGTQQVYAAE